eukprot:scaffold31797_cov63-Phaeocystis_antarctica.AAC.5
MAQGRSLLTGAVKAGAFELLLASADGTQGLRSRSLAELLSVLRQDAQPTARAKLLVGARGALDRGVVGAHVPYLTVCLLANDHTLTSVQRLRGDLLADEGAAASPPPLTFAVLQSTCDPSSGKMPMPPGEG